MKEHVRDQKRRRRIEARRYFEDHNVDIESNNNDIHMILTYKGVKADYWPGTGKYKLRHLKDYRRGSKGDVLQDLKYYAKT